MKHVDVHVKKDGVVFEEGTVTVLKKQPIEVIVDWDDDSKITKLEFYGFRLLEYKSGATSYEFDEEATQAWLDHRGFDTFSFSKPKASGKIQKRKLDPRPDDKQFAHRLIKFTLKVWLGETQYVYIDPILDERPGG